MNKNFINQPFSSSSEKPPRGFSNEPSQKPFDHNLKHAKIVRSSDHKNMLKELGLKFDTEFELIQKETDSGLVFIVPKEKIDRKVLDFEHFRQTVVCFYILYNEIHDRYYIDQTTHVDRRIFDHIRDLERGEHDNEDLQNHFENIKNQGLDPYKCFKVYTVQNTSVMETYTAEESYVLDLELRHVESLLIKKYAEAGYKLYNKTGVGVQKRKKEQIEKKNKSTDFYSITKELEE